MEKDQITPLNVTQEAQHRVFVGLGWDPNEDIGLLDKAREALGGKETHHDLDLSCYTLDQDGTLLDSITAINAATESGKIYHSGDNVEGLGDGDDEQISVELKDLDENIHHIVFAVTIKTGHVFGDVALPEVRLGDGYTNREFLKTSLLENGEDQSAYIFVRLFKDADSWHMHNIDTFVDPQEDLSEAAKAHL